jgi:hypothetical protein
MNEHPGKVLLDAGRETFCQEFAYDNPDAIRA